VLGWVVVMVETMEEPAASVLVAGEVTVTTAVLLAFVLVGSTYSSSVEVSSGCCWTTLEGTLGTKGAVNRRSTEAA
jgi:hypothetical protein